MCVYVCIQEHYKPRGLRLVQVLHIEQGAGYSLAPTQIITYVESSCPLTLETLSSFSCMLGLGFHCVGREGAAQLSSTPDRLPEARFIMQPLHPAPA